MSASVFPEGLTLRVLDIIDGTSVDGPGLRTSVYLAGCSHACPGCHNPGSWDFHGGHEMLLYDIYDRILVAGCDVTFSGGDPLYQASALLPLAKALKDKGFNIWVYTGFIYEEIPEGKAGEDAVRLLDFIDVLVDGPFIESQKKEDLVFRGSENQRFVDVGSSLKKGQIQTLGFNIEGI